MTSVAEAGPTLAVADDGPAVEMLIVRDMLRRGAVAAPVLAGLGVFWGFDGAVSAGYGMALAALNLFLAAAIVSAAARISLALVMVATMGGYVCRLSLVTVAVLLVKDMAWVELVPLCFALLVAHFGLLVWEVRFVSTQLAFPGLKPSAAKKGDR